MKRALFISWKRQQLRINDYLSSMIQQKEIREYHLKYKDVRPQKQLLEKLSGFTPGETPSPFNEWIDEVLMEAEKLVHLHGGIVINDGVEFQKETYSIRLENHVIHPDKMIYHRLAKSRKLILFVCTVGEEISRWSSALMKSDDMAKGYLADLLASEIVELGMDKITALLEKDVLMQDESLTNRYSPGYCGWDVSDQHQLFACLPHNFCGISLSDSALMQPLKSISGIMGLGKGLKKEAYGCAVCNSTDCIYRRFRN